ncbi:MAG: hypothetical protein WB812_07080 [Woeseiaceae bacterium]
MKFSVNSLIAALVLSPALLSSSGSEALAQSTQQRHTDQQFQKRLSGYAEQLEQRLDRLAPRIEALDPSGMPVPAGGQNTVSARGKVAPNTTVGFSMGHSAGPDAGDGEMPGQMTRRNPITAGSRSSRLRSELDNLQLDVRNAERRLKKGDYESDKDLQKEQKRLQRIERNISDLEREVGAVR